MIISHFNATSVRNKSNAISQYLYNNNIAVASICETFLNLGEAFNIKNYTIIRSDRDSSTRGGGVLLAIRNDLAFKRLHLPPNISPIEVCACEVALPFRKICVFSVYIPPRSNFSSSLLHQIFGSIQHNSVLVCGDFNAHHSCWGGAHDDARGKLIIDFFENKNYVLLNDGSMTYYGSTQSALDLTFSSPSLSLYTSWVATNELLGSSHCITNTTISLGSSLHSSPEKRVPRRINKGLLNRKVKDLFESTDFSFDAFAIEFKNHFQKIDNKKDACPNPWWNATCAKANSDQITALEIYKRAPSRINFQNLQSAQKNFKYTVRSEKSKGWKSFCSTIDSNLTVSDFWRIIKRFKGSYKNADAGLRECFSEFCDSLAGPAGPTCAPPFIVPSHDHVLTKHIEIHELNKAISQTKNSAPGLDGLCNSHLKDFSWENKQCLLSALNNILISGNIPESWSHFKIIPLKKKDSDPSMASSYRSIAMAPSLRKLFERILNNRLEWHLETNSLLNPSQSGFRRSKSTKDNILSLWSAVQVAFSKKQVAFVTFIDIKGAFDWANLTLLASKLELLGAPKYFCYLFLCLFGLKVLHISNGSEETVRFSFTGLPQGSVLSPLLFNIYINDIFTDLPNEVLVLAYADDLAVISTSPNSNIARINVQNAVSIIESRLADLQLVLSSTKSKSMLFSKRSSYFPRPPPILLSSGALDYVESFNFLGVIFHEHLKLDPYLSSLSVSCFQYANIMRSLCGVSWGSDPTSLLRIYTGSVRPKLEYAAPLLLNCNKAQLLKLERLQWKCLRIALGAFPSTHTLALELLSQIIPLPERLTALTQNTANQLLANPSHPIHSILNDWVPASQRHPKFFSIYFDHKQRFEIALRYKHPMFLVPYECTYFIPPTIFLSVKKNTCTKTEVLNKFSTFNKGNWRYFHKIFTDGSKRYSNVGSGLWYPELAIEAHFDLHESSTIFTAEANAILESLLLISSQEHKKFLIISDSRSVLEGLASHLNNRSHPLIYEIKSETWKLLQRGYLVRFLWIPSHMGILGNELADGAAGDFSDSPIQNCLPPVLARDLRCLGFAEQIVSWQSKWESSQYGRFLYNIMPRVQKNPWFHNSALPRHVIVTMNRLLCNHTNCNDHLFKINLVTDNSCSCGAQQSPAHLFFDCPDVDASIRRKYINAIRSTGLLPTNFNTLLKSFNVTIFLAIHNFFKDIKKRI